MLNEALIPKKLVPSHGDVPLVSYGLWKRPSLGAY
jgi:hypothetical protein